MEQSTLSKIRDLLQKEADKMSLQLVSVRFYNDKEMGDVLEVLIDRDYNITMGEIQAYTDDVNPLLDELTEEITSPYTLDISSGGSMRVIPFEDTPKLLGKYLDIKLSKSGETITAKAVSFEEDKLNVTYFIKGRKKNLSLEKDDISEIHMGYKA